MRIIILTIIVSLDYTSIHVFCSACANVSDIADAVKNAPTAKEISKVIQQSLKLDLDLNEVLLSLTDELEHLNQSKEESIIEIKSYRGELELSLLRLQRLSIDYVQYIHDKLAATLLNNRENVELLEFSLQPKRFQHEISASSPEQQFVALKQQQMKIKLVQDALSSRRSTGRYEVKFTSDQDIKGFLRGKLALGEIEIVKKSNLYTLSTVQKSYVFNADADTFRCNIVGSCITLDGLYLLVCDANNNNVKRLETRHLRLKDYCKLPNSASGICCLNKEEAAVIVYEKGIHILSLVDKMRITRVIDILHRSAGLAYSSGNLYATTYSTEICIYDLSGQLIKTVATDDSGNKLFVSTRKVVADDHEGRIYVADAKKGLVILDMNGDHVSTVRHPALKFSSGVCTDANLSAFICGTDSKNVLQYEKENGKFFELVKPSDDVGSPQTICFAERDGIKCIIVTSHFSNYIYRCFVQN